MMALQYCYDRTLCCYRVHLFILAPFLFKNLIQWCMPVVFPIYSTLYMWPDLRKGILHTCMSNSMNIEDHNFVIKRQLKLSPAIKLCWWFLLTKFQVSSFTKLKLQFFKVGKSDMCRRSLFANLVTYR